MKILNLIRITAFMGLISAAMSARADEARHQRFHQAIVACQNAEFNKDLQGQPVVVFPTPAPGQRPEFTAEQKALFHECVTAGIIPAHNRHRQPASN